MGEPLKAGQAGAVEHMAAAQKNLHVCWEGEKGFTDPMQGKQESNGESTGFYHTTTLWCEDGRRAGVGAHGAETGKRRDVMGASLTAAL